MLKSIVELSVIDSRSNENKMETNSFIKKTEAGMSKITSASENDKTLNNFEMDESSKIVSSKRENGLADQLPRKRKEFKILHFGVKT
jgi:hypothetical protein